MNGHERAVQPRQALGDIARDLSQALRQYDVSDPLGQALRRYSDEPHPFSCRHRNRPPPYAGRLGVRPVCCIPCGQARFANPDALIGSTCDVCGADGPLMATLSEVDDFFVVVALACDRCTPEGGR